LINSYCYRGNLLSYLRHFRYACKFYRSTCVHFPNDCRSSMVNFILANIFKLSLLKFYLDKQEEARLKFKSP
ncbi:hypothetical protein VIGAN_01279100, partial [Vigna angularis var. angularis]